MPRNITVTFGDGSTHTYQNAPDDVTPDAVQARAEQEFSKPVTALDGGRGPTPSNGIPGQRRIIQTTPEPGFLDKVRGGLEVIPTLISGTVGGVISPIAQLGHELLGGQAFTPQGKAAAAEFVRKNIQSQIYQPRTETGREYAEAVGKVIEPLTGVMPMTGLLSDVGRAAGPVVTAVSDASRAVAAPVAAAVTAPIQARAAAKQAKNVAKSYKNATKIEAAQAAGDLGIALNPVESNPTTGNKMRSVITGSKDVNANLAAANEGKWTDIVKQDLGVPPEGKLNAAAVESALDVASKPYDAIRAIPKMEPSGEVVASIRALDKPAVIGGKKEAAAVKSLIGDTIVDLNEGRSGAQIIDDIRQLRRNAQTTYKSRDKGNNPSAAEVDLADARMGIADALERMIDDHAPTPQVLNDFRAARQRMAQIYDHERAIDYSINKVDPQAYAKMLDERKGNMTGVGADIGKIAANFPEIAQVGVKGSPSWQQGLTRSGVAGTLGYGLGTLIGTPVAGAVTGAVAGKLASGIAAKRMATPAYQATHAIPTDYRPVNNLRPAEINYGPNQLVPYDWSQQVITADQIPNWIPGRNEVPPRVTPAGVPPGPAQIGMSQGPVGGQMGALRAEDARLYQAQAQAEAQAQAAAEQAAAATRQPARGGVQFDLDPVTGKLIPTSSTLKGATPNTQVIESTGKSMTSAADKVASGQMFSMTPEERISWNKTKVDLAAADPGLKGLSDKAIANKMMDRQWVDETIAKARQQAQMFDDIARRSRDAQTAAQAAAKREQMLDLLNDLEEKLRPGRAISGTGQGPKTRAFNRNRLAGASENQNALAK